MAQRFWLFKSEPDVFSFADLERAPARTSTWDGVRNYQARNLLRDEVQRGDGVLFYHSSTATPAVVGTALVVRAAFPDPSQFDPASPYFDAKASPAAPRWFCVAVQADRALTRPVTLAELRTQPALAQMVLLRKGMRLSIQPVTRPEWQAILRLGGR